MPIKILAIDDDIAMTNQISVLLESREFETTTANSGKEGIDLIRQMIPSQYSVRYNRGTNEVYVNPSPSADTTLWIKTYATVPASALFEDDWVFEWGRAECMGVLGLIRSKFTSLPGPGGNINMNGSQLIQQSEAEKTRLQEELLKGRTQPLSFMIG